jgi:hypothetical protein
MLGIANKTDCDGIDHEIFQSGMSASGATRARRSELDFQATPAWAKAVLKRSVGTPWGNEASEKSSHLAAYICQIVK